MVASLRAELGSSRPEMGIWLSPSSYPSRKTAAFGHSTTPSEVSLLTCSAIEMFICVLEPTSASFQVLVVMKSAFRALQN